MEDLRDKRFRLKDHLCPVPSGAIGIKEKQHVLAVYLTLGDVLLYYWSDIDQYNCARNKSYKSWNRKQFLVGWLVKQSEIWNTELYR